MVSCYYEGFGVPKDSAKALEYMDSAIGFGSPVAPFLEIIKQNSRAHQISDVMLTDYPTTVANFLRITSIHTTPKGWTLDHSTRPLTFDTRASFLQAIDEIVFNINANGDWHPDYKYLPSIYKYILSSRDNAVLKRLSTIFSKLDKCDPEPLDIRICKTGDAELYTTVAKGGFCPTEDDYGCNVAHWLFLFGSKIESAASAFADCFPTSCLPCINKPSRKMFLIHPQWPLQLFGTPLSFAIALGCEAMVRALLRIGADPYAPAYHQDAFTDNRKNWTAMHVAVKYHNVAALDMLRHTRPVPTLPPSQHDHSAILEDQCKVGDEAAPSDEVSSSNEEIRESIMPTTAISLIDEAGNDSESVETIEQSKISDGRNNSRKKRTEPLACALSFSSSLERRALHGLRDRKAIDMLNAIGPPRKLAKPTSDSVTPLELAITFDDLMAAEALLSLAPELVSKPLATNPKRRVRLLPVHVAAEVASHRDRPDTLEMLKLLHKVDATCVDLQDSNGETCLHHAVRGISLIPVEWLLQQNHSLLERRDALGRTAIFHCNTPACMDLLIASGADIHIQDSRNQNILHHLATIGESHILNNVCDFWSTLDTRDAVQHTALHLATMSGSRETVTTLVARGAAVSCCNVNGHSPLHIALSTQRNDIVEILLSYGAYPCLSSGNAQHPLHIATETENNRACELLLKSSHTWQVDQDGNSPLHLAARYSNGQIMKILTSVFNQEERLNQTNNHGDAALHLAAFHGNILPLRILLKAGADPDVRQRDGSHIVHTAIRGVSRLNQHYAQSQEVYEFLFEDQYRYLLTLPDRRGRLPWDVAVQNLELDAIYLIILDQDHTKRDSTAYRDLRYLPLAPSNSSLWSSAITPRLQDASQIIFEYAARKSDSRVLLLLLSCSIYLEEPLDIHFDNISQLYYNSRTPWLSENEQAEVYRIATTALNNRQRQFMREGDRTEGPILPESR